MLRKFRRKLKKLDRDEMLLIVYSGPGTEKGWPAEFSSDNISYEELARLLEDCSGRVLLINSAPYSRFLEDYVVDAGVDYHRIGIIYGYHQLDSKENGKYPEYRKLPSFLQSVASCWKGCNYYSPDTMTFPSFVTREDFRPFRWGARWDHYFFPT